MKSLGADRVPKRLSDVPSRDVCKSWPLVPKTVTLFANRVFADMIELSSQMVKNLPSVQKTWVWSLGQEDPLEKGMATHSSILAWRIPWTEKPGGLKSVGSQRVGHNWITLTKRGDTNRHREDAMWQWRQRLRWCGLKPSNSKNCLQLSEAARGKEGSSPDPSQREQSAANTLILDFWPPQL